MWACPRQQAWLVPITPDQGPTACSGPAGVPSGRGRRSPTGALHRCRWAHSLPAGRRLQPRENLAAMLGDRTILAAEDTRLIPSASAGGSVTDQPGRFAGHEAHRAAVLGGEVGVGTALLCPAALVVPDLGDRLSPDVWANASEPLMTPSRPGTRSPARTCRHQPC